MVRCSALRTCALITTEANDVVRHVHHKMPVIIRPEGYGDWLDPEAEPGNPRHHLVDYRGPVTGHGGSPYGNGPKHGGAIMAEHLPSVRRTWGPGETRPRPFDKVGAPGYSKIIRDHADDRGC